MPKAKTPLQRAADAQTEAEKTKKATGLIASALALLGLGASAATPDARMSKRTEVTKHTVTEEDDGGGDGEEEEEDEEDSATDATMDSKSDDDKAEADSQDDKAEEGDEDEKALTTARKAALASAETAYRAAVKGHPMEAALLLRSPRRIEREIRKATGATSVDGAMTALSRTRAAAEQASAKMIAQQAKLEERVSKVETNTRRERVDGIVADAKRDGRASATTKDGRAMLREYGMQHGSTKLRAFVATLPKIGRTAADGPIAPRAGTDGETLGGMGGEIEEAKILTQMTAGMAPDKAAAFRADFEKRKTMNGAARAPKL